VPLTVPGPRGQPEPSADYDDATRTQASTLKTNAQRQSVNRVSIAPMLRLHRVERIIRTLRTIPNEDYEQYESQFPIPAVV
jgi:hypothetical protein